MICPHQSLGLKWRGHQVVYCLKCKMEEPFQPQVVTGIEREAQREAEDVKQFWKSLESSFKGE